MSKPPRLRRGLDESRSFKSGGAHHGRHKHYKGKLALFS